MSQQSSAAASDEASQDVIGQSPDDVHEEHLDDEQDGDEAAPDNTDARAASGIAALLADARTPEFTALLEYLYAQRGFDFRGYKRASLVRRFRKRMQTLGIASYDAYQYYLETHQDEFVQLFNTVLINVTSFFRDEAAWQAVAERVVPALLASSPADAPIRVWSAGCATGQEAFTLAIILAEALGLEQFRARVKIYATDVDEDALQRARAATYTTAEIESVPPEFRTRYFEAADDRWVFRKELRRAVIFGRNDLVQDAPISRIDLLVSRNTLMYFDAATQRRILSRFHFALKDGGVLLLGRAETLLTHASTFAPLDLKNRLFTKLPGHSSPDRYMRFSNRAEPGGEPRTASPIAWLCEAAFDSSPVAQLVVSRGGTVVFANERARTLFGLAPTDIGRPLQDLQLSYRPTELRSLVDQVYLERQPIARGDIEWVLRGGETRWYALQVTPIPDSSGGMGGVTLGFTDITGVKRLQQDLESSNHELETAFEELQSTNEELETTNEELQSAVEELETTNEELQSTNEELETMNEELQSTNEQLQAINDEVRQRGAELNDANAFLESVLASLRGGVVVIDRRMDVLMWNERAEELWGVRAEEAQGRSFLGLDIGLPIETLRPSIRSVLLGAVSSAEQTVDAVNRRGRAIECNVTINPLLGPARDGERPVRGAIIAIDDTAAPPLAE